MISPFLLDESARQIILARDRKTDFLSKTVHNGLDQEVMKMMTNRSTVYDEKVNINRSAIFLYLST